MAAKCTSPIDLSSSSSQRESFTFFYSTESPFSQFHRCTFKGTPLFEEENMDARKGEYMFNSAEQWMMLNKALLFKDYEIATEIMKGDWNPLYCKKLGRKVRNFDEAIWKTNNRRIIYEGNKLKFIQNQNLLADLQSTQGSTLVEASPSDKIYGIGLRATDPRALSRKTWKGKNLLGEILTNLREDLSKESS